MSGESDENFEGVTKNSPDILSPDQNFYPIFFIPDQNLYPKFYTPAKIQCLKRRITRSNFKLVKETNSFRQFSWEEVTKL